MMSGGSSMHAYHAYSYIRMDQQGVSGMAYTGS